MAQIAEYDSSDDDDDDDMKQNELIRDTPITINNTNHHQPDPNREFPPANNNKNTDRVGMKHLLIFGYIRNHINIRKIIVINDEEIPLLIVKYLYIKKIKKQTVDNNNIIYQDKKQAISKDNNNYNNSKPNKDISHKLEKKLDEVMAKLNHVQNPFNNEKKVNEIQTMQQKDVKYFNHSANNSNSFKIPFGPQISLQTITFMTLLIVLLGMLIMFWSALLEMVSFSNNVLDKGIQIPYDFANEIKDFFTSYNLEGYDTSRFYQIYHELGANQLNKAEYVKDVCSNKEFDDELSNFFDLAFNDIEQSTFSSTEAMKKITFYKSGEGYTRIGLIAAKSSGYNTYELLVACTQTHYKIKYHFGPVNLFYTVPGSVIINNKQMSIEDAVFHKHRINLIEDLSREHPNNPFVKICGKNEEECKKKD